MFYYELYGLKVESNIEFIQLLPVEATTSKETAAKIIVEEGSELSRPSEEILAEGNSFGTTENGIWFNNQAGKFVIETVDGTSYMRCTKCADVHVSVIRSFLLGNCLAIMLTQRGKIVIHGSTLVVNDKAILVCGGSGAGKSTISTGMIDNGAKLMADDVSVIDMDQDTGKMVAFPGFPEQKLCRDAAQDRGLNLNDLRFVNEDRDKYALDRTDIFYNHVTEVSDMFILRLINDGEMHISEISGEDKLNAITENLFLKDLYGFMLKLDTMDVLKCVKIAGQVDIFRISRARGVDTKDRIVSRIGEILGD